MDDERSVWTQETSAERVWRRYFEALAQSALTGLYDIIAHPDLVKIWGSGKPMPTKDPRYFYEPAVEAMLEAGVAMEVSTAGLRKPVGEIYPARAYLEMAVDAGVPLALSSDAHVPNQLAYGYDQAVELLTDCGVQEIAVFQRRQRRMEPLG
jgi:histidinol-phosphatase (PHP family)